MFIIKLFHIGVVIICSTYNVAGEEKLKNLEYSLPSVRMIAEEADRHDSLKYHKENENSNLVAVLVENVKKIYDDLNRKTATSDNPFRALPTTELQTTTDEEKFRSVVVINPSEVKASDIMIVARKEATKNITTKQTTKTSEVTLNNTKDLSNDFKPPLIRKQEIIPINATADCNSIYEKQLEVSGHKRRSCIVCDNIETKDCGVPKNKLVPSILCERENDLCYSMHTPFGIIDRGCFNANHNISTYACSCNLCNYISISDMPYVFSNKRDWIHNVIELSRTMRFRKSIFKDMSCLRCEVNVTTEKRDVVANANCLEGNILSIPTEVCHQDETCVVKAIKGQGYIWRGCAKSPLYNYWWTYCDRDLCNYDTLISLYDSL